MSAIFHCYRTQIFCVHDHSTDRSTWHEITCQMSRQRCKPPFNYQSLLNTDGVTLPEPSRLTQGNNGRYKYIYHISVTYNTKGYNRLTVYVCIYFFCLFTFLSPFLSFYCIADMYRPILCLLITALSILALSDSCFG